MWFKNILEVRNFAEENDMEFFGNVSDQNTPNISEEFYVKIMDIGTESVMVLYNNVSGEIINTSLTFNKKCLYENV